jgi:hypothetical protein
MVLVIGREIRLHSGRGDMHGLAVFADHVAPLIDSGSLGESQLFVRQPTILSCHSIVGLQQSVGLGMKAR